MHILIDLQALQTEGSSTRGIGRYTLALVQGILRNCGDDRVTLLFNARLGEDNVGLRHKFEREWPGIGVRFWAGGGPLFDMAGTDQREAAAAIREAVIADVAPDAVLITSLFEGASDAAVATVTAIPTAVILYDLIPYAFPDIYLSQPSTAAWYETCIAQLKKADHLLSISDWSAHDAVRLLNFPQGRITTIGTDVDATFYPRKASEETWLQIAGELGLQKSFLLYTGGIDRRKNIEKLIEAFAALPAQVIANHQLAVACRVSPKDKARLEEYSHACGLAPGSLVLTGFVTDEWLIELYNRCKAFVFPSWYEGFGMPLLEAMRCGAAVIGGNCSSLPEVIGREDAMFDPHSVPDMAAMIEKVLTDNAFRSELQEWALVQSTKFSWDKSARHALQAIRSIVRPNGEETQGTETAAKPTLAFLSPLPPERSGISFYSEELLPALAEHYEITLIVAQDMHGLPKTLERFAVRDTAWFARHALQFDRILYQFGSSTFHSHMFDLLDAFPGTVVMHDFYFSNLEAHHGFDNFANRLLNDHGYHAVQDLFDTDRNPVRDWPVNGRIMASAQGVIVHSNFSRELARKFWAPTTGDDWSVIPLLRVSAKTQRTDKATLREKLGFGPEEMIISSFGHLARSKAVIPLIESFARSDACTSGRARLIFVGACDNTAFQEKIDATCARLQISGRVVVTGWTSEQTYKDHLMASDIAVQMRIGTRGETSAAVLDAQNFGLPVIVNALGAQGEIPAETVLRIASDFDTAELTAAIDRLAEDEDLRHSLGAAACHHIATVHSPQACAAQYRDAIEAFHKRWGTVQQNLFRTLTALDGLPLISLARALSTSLPPRTRRRQFLLELPEIGAKHVRKSRAERKAELMFSVLRTLLKHSSLPVRVEPVRFDREQGHFLYARREACALLEIPSGWAKDECIDAHAGDTILLAGDLEHLPAAATTALRRYAACGVQLALTTLRHGDACMIGLPVQLILETSASAVPGDQWLPASVALWLERGGSRLSDLPRSDLDAVASKLLETLGLQEQPSMT